MAEFDKLLFLQTLRELPERRSPLQEPHYSKCLAQVFDELRKNGSLDLMALDLSTVSPVSYTHLTLPTTSRV